MINTITKILFAANIFGGTERSFKRRKIVSWIYGHIRMHPYDLLAFHRLHSLI